jgi:hypothetical protein
MTSPRAKRPVAPQPATAPQQISFRPSSEEQRQFILSEQFINVVCSPRGEGKTVAGLFSTVYHAHRVSPALWPMRWALVRDTRRNIGLTTARTIREWFPEPYSYWRGKPDEPETITILEGNSPIVTFDCFGVNSPDDLSRFQSYEASGGIWIEEPAPAATNAEFISTGISETVLAVAITSIRGGPKPRIQITFNPPPAEHWTAQLFHLPGFDEGGIALEAEMGEEQREARAWIRDQTRVFFIPPGANKALDEKTPGYRERNRMALLATGRTDLMARLVEGRIGYAQLGAPVTPQFAPSVHVQETMLVLPGRPFFIGWDYGLCPAAVVAQIAPTGQLYIHYAVVLENAGTQQLIERRLLPWLQAHPEVSHYIHVGGHEAVERDQSNSEESSLKATLSMLGGRFIRGPVSWDARRQACDEALSRYVNHQPWVRVNQKDAAALVRCLSGGWHYPTDISGRPNRELPEKRGTAASLGDAVAHLFAVLLRKSQHRENRFGNKEKRLPRPYTPGIYKSRTGA